MNTPRLLSLALLLALTAPAHAVVTIDWAFVGNAGNASDSTGYGSVAYDYRIGTYEVTNAQYAEILNAKAASDPNGLYNPSMGSDMRSGITRSGVSGSFTYAVKTDMGAKPVNFVSFVDAMRFTNWINNGQGGGSTESGAYDMTLPAGTVLHSSLATVWLPTENEWYKAAYYQPSAAGGDTDSYWTYATQSNTIPSMATVDAFGNITNDGDNVANYNNGAVWNGQTGNVTTVGSAGLTSAGYYGAFDLGGNVFEWDEAVIGADRGIRGGSWNFAASNLPSSFRSNSLATNEFNWLGFRLATTPEPSRMMLLLVGIGSLLLRRRR
jgi:formylglycine-generating enzyme